MELAACVARDTFELVNGFFWEVICLETCNGVIMHLRIS